MRKSPVSPGVFLLLALMLGAQLNSIAAVVNSWTRPSSGSWHDNYWSLGKLPGAGQSILITNEGWKAVMISSATAREHPETLVIDSLTISSPSDSLNTLLLNYAGRETPLTLRSFVIHSNSAVTMLGSSLRLNGPADLGLSVGGVINQNDSSVVTGSQVTVGYVGAGTYNFSNGLLSVVHVWVGGPFGGVFNQAGGSNSSGIVHLEPGSKYNLQAGDYAPTDTYFNAGSTFRQTGGHVISGMRVWRGTYLLENGLNSGGVSVPVSDGWSASSGNASLIQTGGTNLGPIDIGYWGHGSATLSNATILGTQLSVGARGSLRQWSGSVAVSGAAKVAWDWIDRNLIGHGQYELHDGTFSAPSLEVGGHFAQRGGSNNISGELFLNGPRAEFQMSGGDLRAQSIVMNPSYYGGGFHQSGGKIVATNQLTISGTYYAYQWFGFALGGGELIVSNIVLNPYSLFIVTNGTLHQHGRLSLTAAKLQVGQGSYEFGPLSLQAGPSDQTNSVLVLSSSADSVVQFRASDSEPWQESATLIVRNWSPSPFGGGLHRVIFGSDATALSTTQLSRILFEDPSGLPPGSYRARILPTGEVVPDDLPPTGRVPPKLGITWRTVNTVQLTLAGSPGASYAIEASSNFVDWNAWTNISTTTGTTSLVVPVTDSNQLRLYRAALLPNPIQLSQ